MADLCRYDISSVHAHNDDIQAALQLVSHGYLLAGVMNTSVEPIIAQLKYV